MNHQTSIHTLHLWGDFACFTRPEGGKVERFTYPCPTPSAARGVFDAIYAKPPQFRWQVTCIELLAMPAYIALRRNEVGEVASTANIGRWMKGAQPTPLLADDERCRQQRQTIAIRNPHYRVHARILPWAGFERQQAAFDEQFRRRASHGKCWMQPALGCREFVAFFRLVDDVEADRRKRPPAPLDQDVGFMVYDVFDLSQPGQSDSRASISVFRSVIRGGVLEIPPYESPDVRKPERRAG